MMFVVFTYYSILFINILKHFIVFSSNLTKSSNDFYYAMNYIKSRIMMAIYPKSNKDVLYECINLHDMRILKSLNPSTFCTGIFFG
ncbi:hypothetical protein NEQG_01864 [Nematocida parisii ERTm3]|uniref:Uncharacterized protein n=1 Tax=Nematocida parisii (strain ERTm3) TaxID=935791 RepID=I3EEZ5_NEMP3|nr:hypothetical protein NEQG_01864 [Nematocida parisii ERTm3]